MIDSEFERKGREMSDELNQIQPIDEVDLEYRLDAEPLPVPVCLQVKTCNGAVVMALQAENDQLRAELETAQDNALRAANLGAEWKERAERYKSERDAAILDARKLAQNWNGVMTSVELEAIVKKYLQH